MAFGVIVMVRGRVRLIDKTNVTDNVRFVDWDIRLGRGHRRRIYSVEYRFFMSAHVKFLVLIFHSCDDLATIISEHFHLIFRIVLVDRIFVQVDNYGWLTLFAPPFWVKIAVGYFHPFWLQTAIGCLGSKQTSATSTASHFSVSSEQLVHTIRHKSFFITRLLKNALTLLPGH